MLYIDSELRAFTITNIMKLRKMRTVEINEEEGGKEDVGGKCDNEVDDALSEKKVPE